MTKDQLVTRIGHRLGSTTTNFLTLVSECLDQVLQELAARGAVKQHRQTRSSAWMTLDTVSYSTRTICNVSTPDWPLDIESIFVPAWQAAGWLVNVSDLEFERWQAAATTSSGANVTGYPRVWRMYPNESQVQIMPAPHAEAAAATVVTTYLKPLTALSGSDAIEQIRQEHFEYVVAGVLAKGATFQDETRTDLVKAARDYELGIRKMIAEANRRRGRLIQPVYHDV
jgi:hypothetical protein